MSGPHPSVGPSSILVLIIAGPLSCALAGVDTPRTVSTCHVKAKHTAALQGLCHLHLQELTHQDQSAHVMSKPSIPQHFSANSFFLASTVDLCWLAACSRQCCPSRSSSLVRTLLRGRRCWLMPGRTLLISTRPSTFASGFQRLSTTRMIGTSGHFRFVRTT